MFCFISSIQCDQYEGRGCVFVFIFAFVFYLHCGVCGGGAIVIVLKLKVIQTFAYIIHMISDQPCEVGNQGLAILQSRKLRLRNV